MKLIVGLGNPGRRYQGTRHNVGFEVVDEVARRHNASFGAAPAEALVARIRDLGGGVVLAKPLTFMNVSGVATRDILHYYRIDLADLLIVADDANLPLGRLRARAGGSDGGHNGLRSVAGQLGTERFARLRVGVGRGDARRDLADHVLARFDTEEQPVIEAAILRAAEAVGVFVIDGLDRVMNAYNRPETAGEEEPAEN